MFFFNIDQRIDQLSELHSKMNIQYLLDTLALTEHDNQHLNKKFLNSWSLYNSDLNRLHGAYED